MATKRVAIRNAVADLLKTQLNGITYQSNIYNNVLLRQVFWDALEDYPTLAVVNGTERTEYMPGAFKWKYLNIMVKVFTKVDDDGDMMEQLLVDIESILDANNSLEYAPGKTTELISLLTTDTDEGLLYPYAVGEISLLVQYDNDIY